MLITKYYIIIFPGSILAEHFFVLCSQTANKQATEKKPNQIPYSNNSIKLQHAHHCVNVISSLKLVDSHILASFLNILGKPGIVKVLMAFLYDDVPVLYDTDVLSWRNLF